MDAMLIFLGVLLGGFTFSTLLFMFFASKADPNPEENEVYSKMKLSAQGGITKLSVTSKEKIA